MMSALCIDVTLLRSCVELEQTYISRHEPAEHDVALRRSDAWLRVGSWRIDA